LCYPPLSRQKYLKKYSHKNLQSSENISERLLWMPSSVDLNKAEVEKIVSLLN